MKFYGMQKMTLLDFPGKVACTLFTGGCNMRCPFCHNARLVTEISAADIIDGKEVLEFLQKRKILDGVCITGGEPLLWEETIDFMDSIKQMGFAVKLDTNGTFPDRLAKVIENKIVDYVAMDIKNSKEKYAMTVGKADFDLAPIEESIGILKTTAPDFEFRTTVVNQFHTIEDVESIAKWISGTKRYFLQNFSDSGNLIGDGMTACSPERLKEMLAAAKKYIPEAQLRGE